MHFQLKPFFFFKYYIILKYLYSVDNHKQKIMKKKQLQYRKASLLIFLHKKKIILPDNQGTILTKVLAQMLLQSRRTPQQFFLPTFSQFRLWTLNNKQKSNVFYVDCLLQSSREDVREAIARRSNNHNLYTRRGYWPDDVNKPFAVDDPKKYIKKLKVIF